MSYRLRKIGVWSAIKISFFINGIIGALMGLFMGMMFFLVGGLISQFSRLAGTIPVDMDFGPPLIGGVAAIILLPIFYGFMLAVVNGIIVTAVSVWLYNLLSGVVGGVEVELDEFQAVPAYRYSPPAPKPPAQAPPAQDSGNTGPKPPETSEGGVDV